jgi:hypothetical protein
MKRILIAVFVLLGVVTVPLFAQYGEELTAVGNRPGGTSPTEKRSLIGIWGGYTSADMSDVNNNLSAVAGTGGAVTRVSNGYSIAADYLYAVVPGLYVGPRVEYIGLNQGKAVRAGGISVTQDYYLIPLLLGGRFYLKDKRSPWNVSGAVFAGVGLGYGKTNSTAVSGTSYSGSGFTGELLIGGEYKLSKGVSLGLDVGYRLADIPSMSTGSSGSGGGGGGYAPEVKRAKVTNAAGKTIKYDFSGMIANLGINFNF